MLKSGTVGVPGAALGEPPAGGPGGLLGGGGPGGPLGGGLGLTWGPSGSALLLDLTKEGIKKSKNDPLDSCFFFSIFSTATGFGFCLGLGLKLNVGSCPWAKISGVTLCDGGGFPRG